MKNRLRVLRAERRWSQAELGERVGVSRQAINAVETGKHDPSLTLAFALAVASAAAQDPLYDYSASPLTELILPVVLVGTTVVLAYFSCMRNNMHLMKGMRRGTIGFAPEAMKGKTDKEKDKAARDAALFETLVCMLIHPDHEGQEKFIKDVKLRGRVMKEVKKRIKAVHWKNGAHKHSIVLTSNPVYSSVPLDKTHWIPGHIIINDVPRLLQVGRCL